MDQTNNSPRKIELKTEKEIRIFHLPFWEERYPSFISVYLLA